MHIRRNNIILLLAGILTGLILGGVFGWWIKPSVIVQKFLPPLKDLSFMPSFSFGNDDEEEKEPVKDKKAKTYYISNDLSSDTVDIDAIYPDPETKDSAVDAVVANGTEEFDVMVKKDVLLYTKDIEMIAKQQDNSKQLDSLLTDDQPSLPKKTYKVEFWKSPINYNGYKFSNNKLTLFGIYTVAETYLISVNNILYLRNETNIYKIENTNEFKPLRKINDAGLIKQLTAR